MWWDRRSGLKRGTRRGYRQRRGERRTDSIEANRSEPDDGSDALLTSWAGRIDDSTLYRDITGLTKCGECTDDEGNPLVNQNASDCPESIGCHDLRRVAITRMRDEGVSWDTISGRVNATV